MKKYLLILLLFIGFNTYSQTSNDPDAQLFITELNTDTSGVDLTVEEKNYITQMVEGLKAIGVWTKIKAVYPFVGGNAFKHKYNLKDPRDLDAAFRLVFSGSLTHSSTGALPTANTGRADTYLNPTISLSQNSAHLSFYSGTNVQNASYDIGDMTVGYSFALFGRSSGQVGGRVNSNNFHTLTTANSLGYYGISRTSSTQSTLWKNQTLTTISNTSSTLPNSNIVIFANVTNGNNGLRECRFASIGDGLTDSEAERLSHLVYYLQGILSRN